MRRNAIEHKAQRYFDQGLVLLFGFNHTEAIRSFRSAAAIDPSCAMAHWGIAYAYGPHVNRPIGRCRCDRRWGPPSWRRAILCAEAVFREDLDRWPRNGWGLLGLERSLRAQGGEELAGVVLGQWQQAWERADVELRLEWF